MKTNPEFEEGWQAFIEDRVVRDCPYLHHTTNYSTWMEGWKTGFHSHVEFYAKKSEITLH